MNNKLSQVQKNKTEMVIFASWGHLFGNRQRLQYPNQYQQGSNFKNSEGFVN